MVPVLARKLAHARARERPQSPGPAGRIVVGRRSEASGGTGKRLALSARAVLRTADFTGRFSESRS